MGRGREAARARSPASPAGRVLGSRFAASPVCFSGDSRLLLACAGRAVKVLSAETGEVCALLTGHARAVTCVARHPRDARAALSASLDGCVRVWDLATGRCVASFAVGGDASPQPVVHLAVPAAAAAAAATATTAKPATAAASAAAAAAAGASASDGAVVFVSTCPGLLAEGAVGSAPAWRVWALDLANGAQRELFAPRLCTALAASPRGDLVAAVYERTLAVWDAARGALSKWTHTHPLTAVAFHPTDPYLATGDYEGRITLWYGFARGAGAGAAPKPVTAALHWHSDAVRALGFVEDGAYMLSGGAEGVLVMWQMDSGHRQFLPRLGGPIVGLAQSPDGARIALCTATNCLIVVDALASRVVLRVQGPHILDENALAALRWRAPLFAELVAEPREGLLVVAGAPDALQLYDARRDCHAGELRLRVRNATAGGPKVEPPSTRVEHVAFSADGAWAATAELVTGPAIEAHTRLRLWRRGADAAAAFSVNTRVEAPHAARLSALRFHPRAPLLLSASDDGSFKLWAPARRAASRAPAPSRRDAAGDGGGGGRGGGGGGEGGSEGEGESEAWQCVAAGTYRDFRIGDAVFSGDGSLIAAAHGQTVALWDADTLALRRTLVHSAPSEPVQRLGFVGTSPFLVAQTSARVCLWDLVSLSLRWSLALPCVALATHPQLPFFVVAAQSAAHRARAHQASSLAALPRAPSRNRMPGPRGLRRGGPAVEGSSQLDASHLIVWNPAQRAPLAVLPLPDLLVVREAAAHRAFIALAPAGGSAALTYVSCDNELVRIADLLGAAAAAEAEERDEAAAANTLAPEAEAEAEAATAAPSEPPRLRLGAAASVASLLRVQHQAAEAQVLRSDGPTHAAAAPTVRLRAYLEMALAEPREAPPRSGEGEAKEDAEREKDKAKAKASAEGQEKGAPPPPPPPPPRPQPPKRDGWALDADEATLFASLDHALELAQAAAPPPSSPSPPQQQQQQQQQQQPARSSRKRAPASASASPAASPALKARRRG